MRGKRGDLGNRTEASFTKVRSVLRNSVLLSVVTLAPIVLSGCTGTVTGNGTSSPAPVAPTITTQPTSQTVAAGQTATFTIAATGTSPLSYQWQKNGASIAGATSASYTTSATTTADSGAKFDVVVSNSAGNATSQTATLTVNAAAVAPSITTQPVNQTVPAGQTTTFAVVATGTAPLSYQWSKNSSAISGATSSTYTTPATTSSDNGAQFTVVVSNSAGSVTSTAATLTVNAAATNLLSISPTSLNFGNVITGSSNTLPVRLSNSGNSNVTISNVTISGPGLNASGVLAGQILAPGQMTTLNVTFAPVAAGNVTGSATITSNATNSPATITLSGTGVTSSAQIVFSAGMESGTMTEWYLPGTGNNENCTAGPCNGGQFDDTPNCTSVASQDYAHTGSWSSKMSNGGCGARIFRWGETQTYNDLWFVSWYYVPQKVTVGTFWNVWQYKSKMQGASGSDPFWTINVENRVGGSTMYLGNLYDWQNKISHQSSGAPDIPVGQWFRMKVHFVCSATGSGRVTVWQGPAGSTQLIWDLQNVNTRYSNGDCQWSLADYSDSGISPQPALLYADDVTISLTDPDLP